MKSKAYRAIPTALDVVHTVSVQVGNQRGVPSVVRITQYDSDAVVIACDMYNDAGFYTVNEGDTVRIRVCKPDGKGVYATANGISEDSHTVYFRVSKQMSICAGTARAVVEITNRSNAIVATGAFTIAIEQNPVGDATDMSDSELSVLQDMIQSVTDSQAKAKLSADKAAQSEANAKAAELSAQTHKNNAQQSANLAEQSMHSAESASNDARAQAQVATTQASTATESARESASSASQALQHKNSATSSATQASSSASSASASANNAKASADKAKQSENAVNDVKDQLNALVGSSKRYTGFGNNTANTYVELAKSKYSYTSGDAGGAIFVDGIVGGLSGDRCGSIGVHIPLRGDYKPSLAYKAGKIDSNACDVVVIRGGDGIIHVYLKLNGYAQYAVTVTGTDGKYVFTPGSTVTGQPSGTVIFRLSEEPTDIERAYPVGTIYINVTDTNPSVLLGFGTWQRIDAGRTLVSSSTSGRYLTGNKGGEETHTLTVQELPSHNHAQNVSAYSASGKAGGRVDYKEDNKVTFYSQGISTGETGGGLGHNNMPPYVAVSIWQRTR